MDGVGAECKRLLEGRFARTRATGLTIKPAEFEQKTKKLMRAHSQGPFSEITPVVPFIHI